MRRVVVSSRPRQWRPGRQVVCQGISAGDWKAVLVPHTWQVTPGLEEYRGLAWYRRSFEARPEWADRAVRIEFEAVFHSATVWVNENLAGKHLRKGYTTFALDI